MVEEDGTDVVEMAVKCKETFACLVVPDFDLVVVTTTDQERLGRVEADASNRAIVLLKSVVDGTGLVVPKLNGAVVKRRSQEGKAWVEGDTLDPIGLGLELCEHLHGGRKGARKSRAALALAGMRPVLQRLSRYAALSLLWWSMQQLESVESCTSS